MIFKEMASVVSNNKISEGIYKTILYAPDISAYSHPGQFVNILPSYNWEYVMRRPMSIASQGDDNISIIYKAIGEGTRIMANWKKGSQVDLIGPLGNYWGNYQSGYPILIGGGVGIAPILNLHTQLKKDCIQHILIMGARNSQEHFLKHDPDNHIYMSTDDGSVGINGNVVDAFKIIFPNGEYPADGKIFSCGPPMMMESVRKYALEHHLKCDLALETIMACGIGICQGCTVERKMNNMAGHSYRTHYALACMDGPIFTAEEIISCL
jgi:dihydroorotate dehydrogenase electron transfer subunit